MKSGLLAVALAGGLAFGLAQQERVSESGLVIGIAMVQLEGDAIGALVE